MHLSICKWHICHPLPACQVLRRGRWPAGMCSRSVSTLKHFLHMYHEHLSGDSVFCTILCPVFERKLSLQGLIFRICKLCKCTFLFPHYTHLRIAPAAMPTGFSPPEKLTGIFRNAAGILERSLTSPDNNAIIFLVLAYI